MSTITGVLDFELNPNNKFLTLNFIVILPPNKEYKPGDKYRINIKEQHLCYAEVIQSKIIYLDEIISAGYNYLDYGLEPKLYIQHLSNQFSGKKWWHKENAEKETRMNVVWLKKITQLNLFDNNEIFQK